MHHTPILPDVREIADAGGENVLNIYTTDFKVNYKANESPVTVADLASHQVVVGGLREP